MLIYIAKIKRLSKMAHQKNNNFMNPLRCLGTILAIYPPCSNFKYNHSNRKAFYKCYSIFMLLILLIGSGLLILDITVGNPDVPLTTSVVTNLAVILSLTALNFTAILVPSLWNFHDFQTFSELLDKANNYLQRCQSVKIKTSKTFYVELAIGHLAVFTIIICTAYIYTTEPTFIYYLRSVCRGLQCYHAYITVMTMYYFALSVKYGFEIINSALRNLLDLPPPINDVITRLETKMKDYEGHNMVRQISQQYEIQIAQIALFNTIFGRQMLLLILTIFMGILASLDVLTTYLASQHRDGTPEMTLGCGMIVMSIVWPIWELFLGAIVTVACSITLKEAQKTADLCLKILLKLPVIAESAKEKAFRNELILLKDVAINSCPTFSAAGFFTIDYSLFLAIFASLTSYVIILIQFHK